ncbi:MAG: hypothetical protein LW875_11845 [Proteobacteria bacterium]|jgi:hypothetical protein|nr:hypothetical protein [Pseudomonadota bacterium]
MRSLSALGIIGLLLLGTYIATRPEVTESGHIRPAVLIEGNSGLLLGDESEALPNSAAAQVAEDVVNNQAFKAELEFLSQKLPKSGQRSLASQSAKAIPSGEREVMVEFSILAGKLDQDSSLKPLGLKFYKDCALGERVKENFRAFCFSRAVRLSLELENTVWDPEEIPLRIKKLGSEL